MSDLEVFAARYRLNERQLFNQGTGQAPLSIDPGGRLPFDGQVEAVRINNYGRFGNTLFSILNALLIAGAIAADHIELPPLAIDVDLHPITSGEFTFSINEGKPAERPTLIGQFFYPGGFEHLVGDYDASTVASLADLHLRNIYAPLIKRVGSLGPHVAVLHFRGGDVFVEGVGHAGYVQPPASYYLKGVEYLCRRLNVDSACLVFEDRTNPAVDFVANELVHRGVPVTLQSAQVLEDLVTIMSAHHLIAPYGTFCEASALLSPKLETFTSFRNIATQTNVHYWTQARIGEVIRLRRARTFIIDDPDNTFTAPNTWSRSDEQFDLITSYSEQKLRHLEMST